MRWSQSQGCDRLSADMSSRLTSVPCSSSNLYHHAQLSPTSGLALIARSNQVLAFSILRSVQKRRAIAVMMFASSFVFLRASADRLFRPGRGSFQIEIAHKRPDVGHSWIAVKKERVESDQ